MPLPSNNDHRAGVTVARVKWRKGEWGTAVGDAACVHTADGVEARSVEKSYSPGPAVMCVCLHLSPSPPLLTRSPVIFYSVWAVILRFIIRNTYFWSLTQFLAQNSWIPWKFLGREVKLSLVMLMRWLLNFTCGSWVSGGLTLWLEGWTLKPIFPPLGRGEELEAESLANDLIKHDYVRKPP